MSSHENHDVEAYDAKLEIDPFPQPCLGGTPSMMGYGMSKIMITILAVMKITIIEAVDQKLQIGPIPPAYIVEADDQKLEIDPI